MSLLIDEIVSDVTDGSSFVVVCRGSDLAVFEQASGNNDSSLTCLIPSEYFKQPLSGLSIGEFKGARVLLIDADEPNSVADIAVELCSVNDTSFISLRHFMSVADSINQAVASRAVQLRTWQRSHRFCSSCGSEAQCSADDRAFVCNSCGFRMYPRIAPCVIGIVIHGSKILLVHGKNHKADVYSAVAGFIEVGETPEEAFAREVKEEVGIEVDQVEYVESQSWPFPGQLMLGFVARFKAGTIKIDTNELVDAAWFDANALPNLPPAFTISAKLISYALMQVKK